MTPSVEAKLKLIVSEQLGVDENDVIPTASFVDDLGADSLDVVELVMAVETEYDIIIPDEKVDKMALVGDVLTYLTKNLPASTTVGK